MTLYALERLTHEGALYQPGDKLPANLGDEDAIQALTDAGSVSTSKPGEADLVQAPVEPVLSEPVLSESVPVEPAAA